MLEKQWNLAPKSEVTCSGTSARRRRLESRKRVEKPIMNPELLRRGYVKTDQLLTHSQVVQLSHKSKQALPWKSGGPARASMRMSRANLQSKMIECSLAREKLAMSNIRLVMSIAQRYDNMGAEMPDLIQAGLIGLLRGIEKFDSSKGFKISTNAKARLEERGVTPSIDRIAESLNMTERKVRNATEAVSKVFSLDREAYPSLNGLPGETLHSYIADTHIENNPWTGVDEWALKGCRERGVRQVGLVALEKLKHAVRKSGLEAMLVQH
ncbi:hypothetical protein SASPL_157311 [Salvia splendens]|uniref:RNA polymerase sigma-70 domain-containing protein n=1 Tax=Salvia splendens TaxID=180675 RepID=A0A8X8VV43_SALSN|nr:hypothetical protein SASPL_157311 [Salvia splendens]